MACADAKVIYIYIFSNYGLKINPMSCYDIFNDDF